MSLQKSIFLTGISLCTIFIIYAFWMFPQWKGVDYPLGRTPDAQFHYNAIKNNKFSVFVKYIGTYAPLWTLSKLFGIHITFNIVIPLIVMTGIPLSLYWMSKTYFNDENLGILSAIIYTFGTDSITTFFQIAIWPQAFSLMLLLIAIGYAIRYYRNPSAIDFIISCFFLLWSTLAHIKFAPITAMVFIIFLISHKRYMECVLMIMSVAVILLFTQYIFPIKIVLPYFNNRPQTLLYVLFPPSIFLGLYGLRIMRKSDEIWTNAIVIAPMIISGLLLFSDVNYRMYLNLLAFASPFIALGLHYLACYTSSKISKKRSRILYIGIVWFYIINMFLYFILYGIMVTYILLKNELANENVYEPVNIFDSIQMLHLRNTILSKSINSLCLSTQPYIEKAEMPVLEEKDG